MDQFRSPPADTREDPAQARREHHRRLLDGLDKVLPFVTPQRPRSEGEWPVEAQPSRRDWTEALDLVQRAAETVRMSESRMQQLVQQAQDEVHASRNRIISAEARAEDAELRLRDMEALVRELELRAREAENRAREAEIRTRDADARAADAEQRVRAAEGRTREAEEWLDKVHAAIVSEFFPRRTERAASA